MLIINGHIKTMNGQEYESGYIFIRDGKIEALGPGTVPKEITEKEASGRERTADGKVVLLSPMMKRASPKPRVFSLKASGSANKS